MKKGNILIVDDNEDILFALNALLSSFVKELKVITKPQNIEKFIESFRPDIILLDMNFERDAISGEEGFYWLKKIKEIDNSIEVVLMTAYADTEKAVQAIKAGAADFVSKPWEKDKLIATINSALKLGESHKEIASLKEEISSINATIDNPMIGESAAMHKIFDVVEQIANTNANILITGENGTGKDLIAHLIHTNSQRNKEIFISIDLGSISESLFESELFGHEKGAFTDAKQRKKGRMEIASGGTLFLDEIANLSLPMQAKMLTAIEKKSITRLGSVEKTLIDVRFICATNANLAEAVENNLFRQDLLYRINTIEIHIPPLRERGNDVIILAEFFLEKYSKKYNKPALKLTSEIKKSLLQYEWPGNVRELQNVIERAVILTAGQSLRADAITLTTEKVGNSHKKEELNLEILEQQAIEKALLKANGNISQAANLLGISRFALYRKINKD